MKMTLLEIVNSVLDRAEDDPVNDIDDTEASVMAASRAKEEYYAMMDEGDWPHLNVSGQLLSLSDVTQATVLQIPDTMVLLDQGDQDKMIQYTTTKAGDTAASYAWLKYMEPADFLDYCNSRTSSDSNVDVLTGYSSMPLHVYNDRMPSYWTTWDDEYIVCDSHHSATESTLQGTKTVVHAKKIPTWTHANTFTPDMPDNMFSAYLSKVTTKYFLYHTQKFSQLDKQESESGKARLRRRGSKTNSKYQPKRYGRNVR